MIDPRLEELIAFKDAPAHYPGWRPHCSTCQRHRLRGVRGIKLETLLIGGRRYTSRQAIQRFVDAINDVPIEGKVSQVSSGNDHVDRGLTEAGF